MNLPPLEDPGKDLPQLMEYELEWQLPIPISEAAYDYQILAPQGQKDGVLETTVFLAALRRKRLNEHPAFMEGAGVSPIAVMPSCLMFLNSLLASGLLSDDDSGFIGAVRLSASLIDVVVLKDGVLSFARSFAPKVLMVWGFAQFSLTNWPFWDIMIISQKNHLARTEPSGIGCVGILD